MFSTWWYHRWSHRAQGVPTNIVYPQNFSSTRLENGCIYLLWRNPPFSSSLPLRTRQQSKLTHDWAHAVPPPVLLFHQPEDWPHPHTIAFRDAILLFLFFPSQNWQQSTLTQCWVHMTLAVPKKMLSHSTSLPPARRLTTSTFHSLPWCNPPIPLSSISEPAEISIGTALSP